MTPEPHGRQGSVAPAEDAFRGLGLGSVISPGL
jgi:hypothetical protein